MSLLPEASGADFSLCRRWRYRLWRQWDESKPIFNFVGCNPSVADELKLDNTVRKVMTLAAELGYGRLEVTNCFAWVDTDPADMREASARGLNIVGADNDLWLAACAKAAGMVVCAWGLNAQYQKRSTAVELLLRQHGYGKLCVLDFSKDGTPKHPLYLSSKLRPRLWA